MGDAISRPSTRAGVSFEVERLEREGDELVVSGHWSGLRGVRFVRPTLVVGERQVLATLEHKPWAPRTDRAWTAAFPWTGDTPDAGELLLAVAPSVSVPLGPPVADGAEPALMLVALAEDESPPAPAPTVPEAAPEPPPPAPLRPAATTGRKRVRQLEQELEAAAQERDALARQLDELRGIVAAADAQRAEIEANLRRERRSADAAGETRDEVQRARAAAERARDAALAQRDEAVQDREAAVRTRARMELAHADAVEAQAAAEAALARAHDERDEAQSQRDEALLAYRALRHHVHSERAGIDRAEHDGDDGADPDEPLGVRTMPAARTIMAELQRPKPSSKFVVSQFDVWVVRVLGSVAAVCFILLLVSIMRVFI
jgi:hypothetical protein